MAGELNFKQKEDGAVNPFGCLEFVYIYQFSVSPLSNGEPRKQVSLEHKPMIMDHFALSSGTLEIQSHLNSGTDQSVHCFGGLAVD